MCSVEIIVIQELWNYSRLRLKRHGNYKQHNSELDPSAMKDTSGTTHKT